MNSMNAYKKSQVTLFIILGIVILIIIIGYLFIASSLEQVTEQEPNQDKQIVAQRVALEACIKQHVQDALALLGQQGGVLYADQSGPYNPSREAYVLLQGDNESYRVYKGIVPHSGLDTSPEYPLDNQDVFVLERNFALGIWGQKQLPPLCDFTMQEAFDCTGQGTVDFGPHTIQHQIKTYVIDHFDECSDREGIAYDWTGADVDIRLNLDDVRVFVRNVSFLPGSELGTTVNVRLKRTYMAASRVLDRDLTSVLFDKSTDVRNLTGCGLGGNPQCLSQGMDYSIVRNIPGEQGSDILIITDELSTVNGRPFSFFTAINNRLPALNLRQQIAPAVPVLYRSYAQLYSGLQGGLHINPRAYDADEDILAAQYSGWGEDYITTFNEDLCCSRGVCALADPQCYTQSTSGFEKFSQSQEYFSSSTCGAMICANKTISPQYRGLHTLRIEVFDGHDGSSDYQDYALIIAGDNDLVGNLNDLATVTHLEEDDCQIFSDMQYNTDLRARGDFAPVDHAQCVLRAVNPPLPNSWNITVQSRAAWLLQCDLDVTSANRDNIVALNRNLGRSDTISEGQAIRACYFYNSNLDAPEFYTQSGPFGQAYALDATGYVPAGSQPGSLICSDHSEAQITDAGIWSMQFSIPYSGSAQTKCKYVDDSIGCGCWKCSGSSCNFFVSYQ